MLSLGFGITSCKRNQHAKTQNTDSLSGATFGKTVLYADESFQPMLTSAVDAFEHIYKQAKVDIKYVDEREALEAFLNFKTPVIFTARKLSDAELKNHSDRGFKVQQLWVAMDAIALVVNEQNADSMLTDDQIKNLLGGTHTNWNQLNAKNSSGEIAVVFQKSNSSTATFIRDSVLRTKSLPKNVYALDTHEDVFNYVRNNKGAIGVMALNWLSDKDDPVVVNYLKGLRVVSVSAFDHNLYYKPTTPNIRSGNYPYRRAVYIINGEGRTGLGTGFASYLASDPGMTLIDRFGLLPAKDPVRVIETRKSFD